MKQSWEVEIIRFHRENSNKNTPTWIRYRGAFPQLHVTPTQLKTEKSKSAPEYRQLCGSLRSSWITLNFYECDIFLLSPRFFGFSFNTIIATDLFFGIRIVQYNFFTTFSLDSISVRNTWNNICLNCCIPLNLFLQSDPMSNKHLCSNENKTVKTQ